ncbi:MAG: protein kinase domain-containing protein, partial [Deltaproteobacteria bacterium]
DRPVALKVLAAEVATTRAAERFGREIQLAARLQHPHILTVFDSGQAAGQLWYAMPYVDGESLRDRLRRECQLSLDEALRITRETAQALQYAHEHGVVHRDVKPENLLLTRDHNVLVADFGIARALGGEGPRITGPRSSIGTPAYMSPEQGSGDRALDARTDVYSLGCVLYEMLAGEPPFAGPTTQAIFMRRLTEPAPSVRKARPGVPEAVDLAIQRALAPVAADRFAMTVEFAEALQAPAAPTQTAVVTAASGPAAAGARRRPVAATALGLGFLLGLGVFFAWRRGHLGADESATPKVLAVLPFENLGDSADAYFADGVTEEVRGKLSRVAGLEVIARGSSNEYRHTSKRPQEIARELGADYLLTATVRWVKAAGGASRVRVTPELVDARPGRVPRTRWQEPFDAALTDVFRVQGDIAGRVVGALDVALGDSARYELAARPTTSLAAYDAFLRGEQLVVTQGKTDLLSARAAAKAYGEAVRLDPTFALAWARLSRVEALRFNAGDHADSVSENARRAADRALALAPDRAESYSALGYLRANIDLDLRRATEQFEHARRLAPHDTDVLSLLGSLLSATGRTDEAVARYAEAARLDPRSTLVARRYAVVLLNLRRFSEAESVATAGLRLAPDNVDLVSELAAARIAQGDAAGARAVIHEALQHMQPADFAAAQPGLVWLDDSLQALALRLPPSAYASDSASALLALSLVQWNAGQYAAARRTGAAARPLLERRIARNPEDLVARSQLVLAAAADGKRDEALAEFDKGRAQFKPVPGSADWGYFVSVLANVYLALGDATQAITWTDSLLHLPGPTTPASLRIDPTYAPLRGDPRFQKLTAGK